MHSRLGPSPPLPKPNDGDTTTRTEYKGYLQSCRHAGSNGWCVLTLDGVTCTGVMPEREMGAEYHLLGKMVYSAKFSCWQFQFDRYEKLANYTKRGTINFLGKVLTGVGPAIAAEIVKAFPLSAIQTIKDHPEKVAERIPRISLEQAKALSEEIRSHEKDSKVATKLYALGLGEWMVKTLIKHFGDKSEDALRRDCFSITKLSGIGFKKAADVADKMGVPADNPGRIKAAISYTVTQLQAMGGHTCVDSEALVKAARDLLTVDTSKIRICLAEMLADRELCDSNTTLEQLLAIREEKPEWMEEENPLGELAMADSELAEFAGMNKGD